MRELRAPSKIIEKCGFIHECLLNECFQPLVRPSDTSRQQKKLQNMQNNSATQPVYSVANTELGSIGRRMRRARGSRPAPSPPPPLQLKFQQRGAKQARATFPAIYCVNQCATAAYRASRAAHSLHQPTSMGAKSGSLRKVLPFAFSCRRRTGLTEQQPALVLVSALLQTGRSRGSCSKRRTAQADGLHDGDSQRRFAGGPKQLLALQRCVSAALRHTRSL